MTEEDLIESAPRPPSAWRRRSETPLGRPSGAMALLVVGVLAGSIGGYIAGQGIPRTLSGLGYLGISMDVGDQAVLGLGAVAQAVARPPPPTLASDDLIELGENVTRQFSVLSGQSAIPVLCETSIGQPGTSDPVDVDYPSTVFLVDGGQFSQLIWPRVDATAAGRTLHTLVFQAQLCPDLPNSQATVRTSGVLTGIGDEYVVFHREPTMAAPRILVATVVLVRVGADLIEISFAADGAVPEDAEVRCLRVAEAAVREAVGG